MAPICTVFTRNTPNEAWAQCPGTAWSTVSGREAKIAKNYWAKSRPHVSRGLLVLPTDEESYANPPSIWRSVPPSGRE